MNIQDIYLSKQLQPATFPAPTAQEKKLDKIWTLAYSKKLLMKLQSMEKGLSPYTSSESLSSIPTGMKPLDTLSQNIKIIQSSLQQMGLLLERTIFWTNSLVQEQTKCYGVGEKKQNLAKKRKGN